MEIGNRPGFRDLSIRVPIGEAGQIWIEGMLWTCLFLTCAIGFLRLSNLEYRAYRSGLENHEFRAGLGSSPSH
jgi:hypothetical protein